jgi:uncharacterized spore protein YtfJ
MITLSKKVAESLQEMFSKMEGFISSKTIVGEAINIGDITLVPLIEVSFALGTGGAELGEGSTGGAGGALGAKLSPAAVIVITNGSAQLINVKSQDGVNKLIDMIPGVLSKLKLDGLFNDKKEESAADEN